MVSHYDKTHASLRFSSRAGGKWKSHTVDAGVLASRDVGKYTSLTVDGTGRPGIAYLAIVKDGRVTKSEVRYAQAKVAQPAAATSDGKIHISYVDAAHVNLLTIDYPGGAPEVVDDGLRMDGTTNGGQPRPVYHFVGDNSGIIVSGSARAIVYQDGTTEQLLLA